MLEQGCSQRSVGIATGLCTLSSRDRSARAGRLLMRDPNQYAIFSDERSRPFFSLLERVPQRPFRDIVDLGCGSGELTAHLAGRWPEAHVVGLDNSPQMLANAGKHAIPNRLEFVEAGINDFDTPQ